jgi:cytochrome c-type biogenesis protein CcmH/NrfG
VPNGLLADAEYSADHYAEANAAADRLLAVDPSSVPGLTRKGLSMLQLADRDEKPSAAAVSEARKLLVRANRLAPDEAQPLVGYYESFRLAGQVPPQIAIEGLLQAVATVPQDMRARQLLVDELVREQRYGDAIAALAPIAFSPHDSPRRAEALKQMAELKAKLAQHQTKS